MLKDILEIHRQGNLVEAERRYREWLQFNPDDPETMHLLGIARREQGDLVEALQLVRRAHELIPDRVTYLVSLGGLELHAGLLEDAKLHFEAALEADPNIASAYNALGQIALMQGDESKAEERFRFGLRAEPEQTPGMVSLGNTLIGKGQLDEALKHLTVAVELDPKDAAAQASLGRAYLLNGNFSFAEQALLNALKIKPDYGIAKRLLGESAMRQRDFPRARQLFNELAEMPGERAHGLAGLADVLRAQNELGGAATLYRQSLELDRSQSPVLDALLFCLAKLGRRDEAIRLLTEQVAARPTDANAMRALAGVFGEAQRYEEAANVLHALLQQRPDDFVVRAGFATMLELLGQLDQAADEAQAVLDLRPDAIGSALLLARARLRQGDAQAARALLAPFDPAKLNRAQNYLRHQAEGLACDALADTVAAIAAFSRANAVVAQALPQLPPLTAQLREALIAARAQPAQAPRLHRPVFLLGTPGSGVATLAALLADQPSVALLTDRLRGTPRHDLFSDPDVARSLIAGQDDQARLAARRYQRGIERGSLAPDRVVIDWLPTFDARLLPTMWRAFGPVRLIVATRDPRAALLEWLAFGAATLPAPSDPVVAAQWLALATQHLSFAVSESAFEICLVDAERLRAEPQAVADELGRFLLLADFKPGRSWQRAQSGLGGLPTSLAPQRFRAYESALSEAFARMTQVGGGMS